MVGRGELTEAAWTRMAAFLPANGRRGGQWRDHRTVLNGILWKLRTGAPWRDLPERYGPWQTGSQASTARERTASSTEATMRLGACCGRKPYGRRPSS